MPASAWPPARPPRSRPTRRVRQAYLGEALAAERRRRPRAHAAAPRPEMLGVGRLVAGYGAAPVLHGIDLQVRRGEVVALLGANGAGKSTLMRALAGLHRPVQRRHPLRRRTSSRALGAEQIVARGLVLVPEGRQVFPGAERAATTSGSAPSCSRGDREARRRGDARRFPRLRERLHQRAGLLSGGEQQMLAIARGLMARPRILLLDEPSLGLAPKVIAELFAALDAPARRGHDDPAGRPDGGAWRWRWPTAPT